mmetsp:Transcript_12078/g.30595  ORF Transcript_12078/g.30595 Transcript_12078/m.30595 type:complete len:84 (+) Transcript_12078:3875-4126(+)
MCPTRERPSLSSKQSCNAKLQNGNLFRGQISFRSIKNPMLFQSLFTKVLYVIIRLENDVKGLLKSIASCFQLVCIDLGYKKKG